MKKNLIIISCLVLALVLIINVLIRSSDVEYLPESPLPQVSASIYPLYDIARTIGNTVVDVQLILPPGASPHTYELNPQKVNILEQSERVFVIGYGADDWIIPFVSDPSRLTRVDRQIELRNSTNEDESTIDPHYWLNVTNAMKIAQTIADELRQIQPEKTAIIQMNLQNYLAELERLDLQVREQLSRLSNKHILTFHDAWYYFADAYGLTISGTFEPQAGREPTPAYLVSLANIVQSTNIHTMYSEPQFSSTNLQSFLSDYTMQVAVLDPIGGSVTTDTYIHLIQSNVQTIIQNQ